MLDSLHYRLFMHEVLKNQYRDRSQLDAIARRRLYKIVNHAAHIPFWQDRFQKAHIDLATFTSTDLPKLPVISKEDFWGKPLEQYTDAHLLPTSYYEDTSGSTGQPFRFYHDKRYEALSPAVQERHYRSVGLGKRYPVIFLRSVERRAFARSNFAFFFIRNTNTMTERLADLRQLLSGYPKGVILHGMSSWFVRLAELCQETGTVLPIRGLLGIGEDLPQRDKELIKKVFNVEVRLGYGMSEMGNLAFSCEFHRRHLSEDWIYPEITDEYGAPLPPGTEGRVVLTSFFNRTMPLIRYNTGDLGVISEEYCPCGRTPRTISINGRQAHVLRLPNNKRISIVEFCALLDSFESALKKYQIVWHGGYTFTLRVIVGDTFGENRVKIENRLAEFIDPQVNLTWEKVDSIPPAPSGKARYFVNAAQ